MPKDAQLHELSKRYEHEARINVKKAKEKSINSTWKDIEPGNE